MSIIIMEQTGSTGSTDFFSHGEPLIIIIIILHQNHTIHFVNIYYNWYIFFT